MPDESSWVSGMGDGVNVTLRKRRKAVSADTSKLKCDIIW